MAIRPHRYPPTPEQVAATAMLGGPPSTFDPLTGGQFEQVGRLFGTGEAGLDRMARDPAIPGVAPWPKAAGNKKQPLYDKAAVREALQTPRTEDRTTGNYDPRQLHGSQAGITRGGLDHYMTDEYAKTGKTYADQGNAGNQQPVVYEKEDGRNILLSGHHRAGAALLKGEKLNAIQVRGQ